MSPNGVFKSSPTLRLVFKTLGLLYQAHNQAFHNDLIVLTKTNLLQQR